MPAHDWTLVGSNIFHDFHVSWTSEIKRALNAGILPGDYYALSEQNMFELAPDVIALEIVPPEERETRGRARSHPRESNGGGTAVAMPPPQTEITVCTEGLSYDKLRRTIVIRHTSDHSVVALIEILSRANKASRVALDAFLVKAQSALKQNVHLLIVDLYPPGRLDPKGMHGALWEALAQPATPIPRRKPLLAASYESELQVTAYVQPFAVRERLPAMPLFLRPGFYVNVPLEQTYVSAFESVPAYWRGKIERRPAH